MSLPMGGCAGARWRGPFRPLLLVVELVDACVRSRLFTLSGDGGGVQLSVMLSTHPLLRRAYTLAADSRADNLGPSVLGNPAADRIT